MGGRRSWVWEAVVFGAPHVERALAFRAVAGQPAAGRVAKRDVSGLGRLGSYTVDNASTSPAHCEQPVRWRLSGPQLVTPAPNRFTTRGWSCRQRLASVFVDGSCLVRYKRAGAEARYRSRRAAGRKSQARERGDLSTSCDNKSTAEIGERHLLRGCETGLLVPDARSSNQPSAITLTRRCEAGCEAGVPATHRGTIRLTRVANLVPPGIGSTQSKTLWVTSGVCPNRCATQVALARRPRFRALSGAMKRPSVSVETSAESHRATERVRVCVGWVLSRPEGR